LLKHESKVHGHNVSGSLFSDANDDGQGAWVASHLEEANNVHRFKHLQRVIDEAIQSQRNDKVTVRGFHSLKVKKKDKSGSPSSQQKVLESISDKFEKITQKSLKLNASIAPTNSQQPTQMSHYVPSHLALRNPQKWLGSIKSIQSIQSLHTIKSINSMQTN